MRSIGNKLILIIFVSLLLSGCVNRATATLDASADLSGIKSIHVTKFAPDSHDINLIIADNLRKRGFLVTTGTETPSDIDIVITYVDKWMWDLTMYMLELTITFRDPKTDYPLATGNSYHTSLTRKSPEEMVEEVLTNIFKQEHGNG